MKTGEAIGYVQGHTVICNQFKDRPNNATELALNSKIVNLCLVILLSSLDHCSTQEPSL